MRKFLWFAAIFSVALAAGFVWLAHRPGSSLAPYLAKCCPWAVTSETACNSCYDQADDAPSIDELPSEPVAIEEPAPLTVALADVPLQPPAIVINEEDPPAATVIDEPVELAIYKGRPIAPADVPACPLTMPYCQDDAKPTMPYASDTEESETVESVSRKIDELELQKNIVIKTAPVTDSAPPRCEIEPSHQQHYSGCPAPGHCPATGHCPYTGGYSPYRDNLDPFPERKRTLPRSAGDIEEADEPPARLQKKIHMHESRKPVEAPTPVTRNSIDTMEYRRSDGGLGEFAPGPY